MILFDLESNGLLDELDTIHCLVTKDTQTGEVRRFRGDDIKTHGLPHLANSPAVGGHNIIKFDLPALQKVYGFAYSGRVFDTLVMSRLVYADIGDSDMKLFKRKRIPGRCIGSHGLRAWGFRLGILKGDFGETTDWAEWSKEMEDYCEQDVHVTHALFNHIRSTGYSKLSAWLEHEFCKVIQRQEARGVGFDRPVAEALLVELLAQRTEAEQKLKDVFGTWEVPDKPFIPKRDNAKKGYRKGVPVQRTKIVEFNPGSRQHIANRLIQKYGWEPQAFTDKGSVQVSEEIIAKLPYPEVPLILKFLVLDKRIGQLSEGNQAWLKLEKNGRIYGSVNTGGAVTGRCTHANPNLAQVPNMGSLYGRECRSLFIPAGGYKLVGCDAAGLELRCLAHYMAKWDHGEYGKIILDGRKEEGTDIHSMNQKAAGLPDRDTAKTFIYGYLYGAGDGKLGSIIKGTANDGTRLRAQFQKNIPALGNLTAAVKRVAAQRKWLRGLDGRKLHVRSDHAALNTLLQSAGALVMKLALVIADWYLQAEGLVPIGLGGTDYEFVLNIHDEIQAEVNPEHAEKVGEALASAINAAGEYFSFQCPLAGEYAIGNNWSETH